MNEFQARTLVEKGALRNGTKVTAIQGVLGNSGYPRSPVEKSFLLNRVAIKQPDDVLFFVCREIGAEHNVWIAANEVLALDGMDVHRTLDSYGLIPQPPRVGRRRRRASVQTVDETAEVVADEHITVDG